jgi:hypothetical protein
MPGLARPLARHQSVGGVRVGTHVSYTERRVDNGTRPLRLVRPVPSLKPRKNPTPSTVIGGLSKRFFNALATKNSHRRGENMRYRTQSSACTDSQPNSMVNFIEKALRCAFCPR